ncbi:MAG: hypothetical protein ACLP7J_03520 [Streptosporangiaceae bacterium]
MIEIIVIAAVAYLVFHLGAGATHHRYRKALGLRPGFRWSLVRGPYRRVTAIDARRPPADQGIVLGDPEPAYQPTAITLVVREDGSMFRRVTP